METRQNQQALAVQPEITQSETKSDTTLPKDETMGGWLAEFKTNIVINFIQTLEKKDSSKPEKFAIPFLRHARTKWKTNIIAEGTTEAASMYFFEHLDQFEREFNLGYNPESIQKFLNQELYLRLSSELVGIELDELAEGIYQVNTLTPGIIEKISKIFWDESRITIKPDSFIINVKDIAISYLKSITELTPKSESKEAKVSSPIVTPEVKRVSVTPVVLDADEKKVVIKDISELSFKDKFFIEFSEHSYFEDLYQKSKNPEFETFLHFIKTKSGSRLFDYDMAVIMQVSEYLFNKRLATSGDENTRSEMIQAFFEVFLPTTTNGEQSLVQMLFAFGSKADIQRTMLEHGFFPSYVVKHSFNEIMAEFESLYSDFFKDFRDYLGYQVERDGYISIFPFLKRSGPTSKQTHAQIFDDYFNGHKKIENLFQAISEKNYDEINIALFALSYRGKTSFVTSINLFYDYSHDEKFRIQAAFNVMLGLCYGGHIPALDANINRFIRRGLLGSTHFLDSPKEKARLEAFYRCMFIVSTSAQHIRLMFRWFSSYRSAFDKIDPSFDKIDPSFLKIIKNKAVLLSKSSKIAGILFIFNVNKVTTQSIRLLLLDNLKCSYPFTSHDRIINKICLNLEDKQCDANALMLKLHHSIADDFLPVIKFLLENNSFPVVLIDIILSYLTSYFTSTDISEIIRDKLDPIVIKVVESKPLPLIGITLNLFAPPAETPLVAPDTSIEVITGNEPVQMTTVPSVSNPATQGQNTMPIVESKSLLPATSSLGVSPSSLNGLFSSPTMSQNLKNPKINISTFLIELLKFVGTQLAAFFLVFAPGNVYYADNQYKQKKY